MIPTPIRPGMHVTLRQLKVFESVVRLGNITRAAEELYLSQSTVSTQVKQLTDVVGEPLFQQVARKFVLTDIGADLERACKEMFDSWARFETAAADAKKLRRGSLRLTCVTTARYFIPHLLDLFSDRFPGIDVRLEFANHHDVVERLARNDDDLYVMTMPPRQFDVTARSFLDNPLVVIASPRHPLAKMSNVSLQRLAEEPILLRERGSGTRMAAERYFREQGVELNMKIEVGSNEDLKQAVAGGMGVTVISRHALTHDATRAQLSVLDVSGFPIERSWYVVHPGDRRLSVAARTFFEFLEREARGILASTSRALGTEAGDSRLT